MSNYSTKTLFLLIVHFYIHSTYNIQHFLRYRENRSLLQFIQPVYWCFWFFDFELCSTVHRGCSCGNSSFSNIHFLTYCHTVYNVFKQSVVSFFRCTIHSNCPDASIHLGYVQNFHQCINVSNVHPKQLPLSVSYRHKACVITLVLYNYLWWE